MTWNRPMLLSLVLLLLAVTVNSKYRGPPDAVKMINVRRFRWMAIIEWDVFEVDKKSYKIEFVGIHDGKSITETVEKSLDPFNSHYSGDVNDLEPNETYIVRVFAVNEHGQSPPSPHIILSQDDAGYPNWISAIDSRPLSPRELSVEYILGNRVKVTWKDVQGPVWGVSENEIPSPTEFIIRYGDSKNTSLWNTRKTDDTWIILDDLKKDTQYCAYVVAKKDNLTSSCPSVFPISLDEDMTGLPKPVITIVSAFKKEVFTTGDPMTIKCSIPPNSNLHKIDMELTIGERVASLKSVESVTMYTTASEDVDTARCRVSVRDKNQVSRSSHLSWKVEKPLNDEYLRRRFEEAVADKTFMSFRKA
ncbi:hypothetical protein CAEBREN_02598 [Caenorhabditis brenneri]|uniref:Fibronectin type-III domain-containing protein n=1 Tax=Caenorhabditis brenneri TaxID=135651 RepID=G0P802_CAEBE|nr:hypothetical protein CAEBREN_02598 [Caenorhabditis brenneri]